MVKFLVREFEGTPVFIVLTTHIEDVAQNQRVILRNRAARDIAGKYGLPVIDLYEATEPIADQLTDGVHFTEEGYRVIAKTLVEALINI